MPYADPEQRKAYARERHHAHPEIDAERQRHRVRAERLLREMYRPEYDALVRDLGYEGVPTIVNKVKTNRKYVMALRELKARHPEAWQRCRDEAR